MTTQKEEMNKVLTDITKTQTPIKTINLTPSWAAAAEIYLRCVEAGDSWTARQEARKEIIRMAQLLDTVLIERKAQRCADGITPCERRSKSTDNTCEHYPN